MVKAEVDFIRSSFRATGKQPGDHRPRALRRIRRDWRGAEALRLWRNGQQTTFIGLDAVRKIEYRTTRNEETRCHFCKNNCLRTFIDIRTATQERSQLRARSQKVTKVPLMHGEQRLIIATCEKGTVEDVNDMKEIKAGLDEIKRQQSQLRRLSPRTKSSGRATRRAWPIRFRPSWAGWNKGDKERIALMENRKKLRIGIPRVLNIYTYAPLFNAYLESLGVQPENIVYSDYTSRSCTARARAAARSIRASRRRSALRTSTT